MKGPKWVLHTRSERPRVVVLDLRAGAHRLSKKTESVKGTTYGGHQLRLLRNSMKSASPKNMSEMTQNGSFATCQDDHDWSFWDYKRRCVTVIEDRERKKEAHTGDNAPETKSSITAAWCALEDQMRFRNEGPPGRLRRSSCLREWFSKRCAKRGCNLWAPDPRHDNSTDPLPPGFSRI